VINLPLNSQPRTVLALGAELKANYCIIKRSKAYLFAGFDDLKKPAMLLALSWQYT